MKKLAEIAFARNTPLTATTPQRANRQFSASNAARCAEKNRIRKHILYAATEEIQSTVRPRGPRRSEKNLGCVHNTAILWDCVQPRYDQEPNHLLRPIDVKIGSVIAYQQMCRTRPYTFYTSRHKKRDQFSFARIFFNT